MFELCADQVAAGGLGAADGVRWGIYGASKRMDGLCRNESEKEHKEVCKS